MSRFLCLALLGFALAMIPTDSAFGCNGRGGISRGYGNYYGGGQFANNVRMQQQMQQAYLMQQQALAIQKAEAKHAVRLANAEKHRAEQAAKSEADKQKRSPLSETLRNNVLR